MTELELLQRKMNRLMAQLDWVVVDTIYDCAEMYRNNGDKRAVRAFLILTEHFYGRGKVVDIIENYGFMELREFL